MTILQTLLPKLYRIANMLPKAVYQKENAYVRNFLGKMTRLFMLEMHCVKNPKLKTKVPQLKTSMPQKYFKEILNKCTKQKRRSLSKKK